MAKKKPKSEETESSRTNKKGTQNPKLGRKEYKAELARLQAELVKLLEWVVRNQIRVIVVFEGRGKSGNSYPRGLYRPRHSLLARHS